MKAIERLSTSAVKERKFQAESLKETVSELLALVEDSRTPASPELGQSPKDWRMGSSRPRGPGPSPSTAISRSRWIAGFHGPKPDIRWAANSEFSHAWPFWT